MKKRSFNFPPQSLLKSILFAHYLLVLQKSSNRYCVYDGYYELLTGSNARERDKVAYRSKANPQSNVVSSISNYYSVFSNHLQKKITGTKCAFNMAGIQVF